MKIVLDVFGGDNAPGEILEGARQALSKEEGFSLVLCGKRDIISEYIKNHGLDEARAEILDAEEVISNDENPVNAVRSKPNSSIVKALEYLNANEDAQAFVSAGSTGAVLTGSVLLLRRIRGINRPALAPLLPTLTDKNVLLIDCGANVEVKPLNLVQFAQMGRAYMKTVCGVAEPKVGLLSNGAEDAKGSPVNKEAFPLLKEKIDGFVGNAEAREILGGDYDVIVSDGFSGNIALKSCEGTALTLFSLIKSEILKAGIRAKIGYLFLKPVFKRVKHKMDYNENGGAVLLGLQKVVIKSHGSSGAKTICNSILQAKKMVSSGLIDGIGEELNGK